MSATWHGNAPPPEPPRSGLAGWIRIGWKGGALAALVLAGLVAMLALRLIEKPFFGARRPITPSITVFVCRNALRIIGLRTNVEGHFSQDTNAIVANHSSWLDIFVLNARKRVYFVSKSEVAGWPGIGWLAKVTGTVFIARDRTKAADQAQLFRDRLGAGHRLLFFPEGTSSDGQRVLPFKPTLFAAFFAEELRDTCLIQPVSLTYQAPEGADRRFYGWWGDMEFAYHVLAVLGSPQQGEVTVRYHAPLQISAFESRKTLASAAEIAVRKGTDADFRGQ